MSSVPSGGGVPKGRRGSVLPCLGKATPIKLCSPRALIGSVARKKSKRPTGSGALISANFTCSFCNSSRRMRSWRLSPACPTAPWSFRSPRKTVCRLLWIWCFPCSLLLGGRPVFRLLPVEGSMPHPVELYTLMRGGIIPPHPLARDLIPRAPILYYKSAPSIAALSAMLGAILYKVRGAGITSPPGCRGRAPAWVKRQSPCGHT